MGHEFDHYELKTTISVIKHARKSVLFNAAIQSWIKKDSNSLYILRHYGYSFDGAEVCELLALFILNHLGKKFGKESIGLYRDDGLAIIKIKSARLADKTRNELHKIFDEVTIQDPN